VYVPFSLGGAGSALRPSGLALDRITFPTATPILGVQRDPNSVLRIDRQLACVTGQPMYLKPPKTNAGIRTLPLAAPVAEALTAHVRQHPPLTITLPWGRPDGAPVTVALLFHHEGHPLDRFAWSKIWRSVQRDARVSDVDYHGLRHYAVSSMIRYGATIKEVQSFAGHASSRTTLDVYGHLWSDSEDRIRAALTSALDFSKIQNLTDDSRTVF
jgi:integrase